MDLYNSNFVFLFGEREGNKTKRIPKRSKWFAHLKFGVYTEQKCQNRILERWALNEMTCLEWENTADMI